MIKVSSACCTDNEELPVLMTVFPIERRTLAHLDTIKMRYSHDSPFKQLIFLKTYHASGLLLKCLHINDGCLRGQRGAEHFISKSLFNQSGSKIYNQFWVAL